MIWERGEGSSFTVRMLFRSHGGGDLAIGGLFWESEDSTFLRGEIRIKKRILMQQLGQDFVFSDNFVE